MALEDDFHVAQPPLVRRWLIVALILSLGLHVGLYHWFQGIILHRFNPPVVERLVPRAFTAKRVEIDAKLLEEEPKQDPAAQDSLNVAPKVTLPAEEQTFEKLMEEVQITPAAPELTEPIVNEKPKVESRGFEKLTRMQADATKAIEREMQNKLEAPLPETPSRSLMDIAAERTGSSSGPGTVAGVTAGQPGFSDLDALLAQSGNLKAGTIRMPGDLLFEYDKAELDPRAVSSLEKLGKLLQRDPSATFRIDGHTDSFGGPDYNLPLSVQRAEAVKTWLVTNFGIDPNRIAIRGLGSTKLIASGDGTIEEQQINRRVEIIISPGPQ